MLNPRIDSEEIELESFETHLEFLEDEGMDNNMTMASLKRYSGPLADYMDSVYEEARESPAVKSNIHFERENITDEIGGNRRIIGGMMTELNDFYEDQAVYDDSFRWDVGLIPGVTDQLREVDGVELPFEEEAEMIYDIIEEYQPVTGPGIVDRFEDELGYSITQNQFISRIKALRDQDIVSTERGYRLENDVPKMEM